MHAKNKAKAVEIAKRSIIEQHGNAKDFKVLTTPVVCKCGFKTNSFSVMAKINHLWRTETVICCTFCADVVNAYE